MENKKSKINNSKLNTNKNLNTNQNKTSFGYLFCDYSSKSLFITRKILDSSQKDKVYENFVKILFSYFPGDFNDQGNIESFKMYANTSYEFLKNANIDDIKLVVDENKGETYLYLYTENKPFIIDSLKCYFQKLSIKTNCILHPIFNIDKDKNGKITNIESINNYKDNKIQSSNIDSKSFVFASIDTYLTNKELDFIYKDIKLILGIVNTTCQSYNLMIDKVDQITNEISKYRDHENILEILNWLKNDKFTFLNYLEYDISKNEFTDSLGSSHIWKGRNDEIIKIIDNFVNAKNESLLYFGSLNEISPIHRSRSINYLLIKPQNDNSSNIVKIFLGLYGSALYYTSVSSIPILKEKCENVISNSGFIKNSFNYKKLKSVIESFPREALFEINEEELKCVLLQILSGIESEKLKLFAKLDFEEKISVIYIFLPSSRLTPENRRTIYTKISNFYNSKIIGDYTTKIIDDYSYLSINIKSSTKYDEKNSSALIEKELDEVTRNWEDLLHQRLSINNFYSKNNLITDISSMFPVEYQQFFNVDEALNDIILVNNVINNKKAVFKLSNKNENEYLLKILNLESKIELTDIIPLIENLGFNVIDEKSYLLTISNDQKVNFCIFNIKASKIFSHSIKLVNNIEKALYYMYYKIFPVDELAKLISYAGLSWDEVIVIKAFTSYLVQIRFIYDNFIVTQTLLNHPNYVDLIYRFFQIKFDSNYDNLFDSKETNSSNDSKSLVKIQNKIKDYLKNVKNSLDDKILSSLYDLVKHTLRTNKFLKNNNNEYVSFKIDSANLTLLPLPRPYKEIYVYANDFEAIHLRGGKVSRGGIRWSDRGGDYRTEILGLMKAQVTKNTVIVPTGSKGGFYVKSSLEGLTREQYQSIGVNAYSKFLNAVLELTDNIEKDNKVRGEDLKIYDNFDPYLAVAADKGTASFSDFANDISVKKSFWLDDAFASGGSSGYDHKEIAITSRGAWISVIMHFQELGIDPEKDKIRVIGIGDMSGDVFGNGMLLSKSMQLVAAFNHMHIFIDPNPDPKISYIERKRLFNLKGSMWSDYNKDIISSGGGVFLRSDKNIKLSKEIKKIFNIQESLITPNELITYILKSEIDLIWNGGIGTYVKSSLESNEDVGDKSNDALRVNGCDLKAKIVGEGGNLGFSQLGRIEYVRNGGRINTDFIDNSAGVDCSDHEVNIKILLNISENNKLISREERNKILKSISKNIIELVLEDNKNQTLTLMILENSKLLPVEIYQRLITSLESKVHLNRKIEYLPTDELLKKYSLTNVKLSRPELCVILSYSKIWVKKELENSKISKDSYFRKYLINYFPVEIINKFNSEIISHPLSKEIIITRISNIIVNQLTGPIINHILDQTGTNMELIIKKYFIIYELFNIEELWVNVNSLPKDVSSQVRVDLFSEIIKLTKRGILWLINNDNNDEEINANLNKYSLIKNTATRIIKEAITGKKRLKLKEKVEYLTSNRIPKNLALNISYLDSYISLFDVVKISNNTKIDPSIISGLYYFVGDELEIDWLRKISDKSYDNKYITKIAVQSIKDDLYKKQRIIISKLASIGIKSQEDYFNWAKNNSKTNIYLNFINEMRYQEDLNLNMVYIASKKLEDFIHNI